MEFFQIGHSQDTHVVKGTLLDSGIVTFFYWKYVSETKKKRREKKDDGRRKDREEEKPKKGKKCGEMEREMGE